MGKYHVTVIESQRCDISHRMVMSHVKVTTYSKKSQLTSSMETIGVKEHSHIVIVYVV